MLSATLEEGLKDYAIGAKIRALRLKKKMGLVELGQHSGLSPALLSKLERGRLFPTLPRIALVFSVGLDYFFGSAREKPARCKHSSPVTRCTSTAAFPMGTAAAAPQHAAPSWLRPPDRLPRRPPHEPSLRKPV